MGLLIPFLVAWVGTPNLLLLAAISMAGPGWAFRQVRRLASALQTQLATNPLF